MEAYMSNIPVIIPLGNGSRSNDDELKILLRSLEKNARSLGTIYLATIYKPSWLKESDELVVVPLEDHYMDCKDCNLFEKTHKVIEMYGLGKFLWASDDNVLMQPIDLNDIPVIHNHRRNEEFTHNEANRWRTRVRNTLDWAWNTRGVHLEHQYECHCPQLFDGQALLEGMKGVDYGKQPGLTIYTTWRVVTDSWHGSVCQLDYKATYEKQDDKNYLTDDLKARMFIGYNDACFLNGLRERLFNEFPDRSRFER